MKKFFYQFQAVQAQFVHAIRSPDWLGLLTTNSIWTFCPRKSPQKCPVWTCHWAIWQAVKMTTYQSILADGRSNDHFATHLLPWWFNPHCVRVTATWSLPTSQNWPSRGLSSSFHIEHWRKFIKSANCGISNFFSDNICDVKMDLVERFKKKKFFLLAYLG